jgi:F-type H+-transporting ATPase subunit delta
LITNAIARRYAKALVQLAAEEKRVELIHGELTRFEKVLAAQSALRSVLINPAYGIDEKRAIMKDVMVRLDISGTVANFLLLILERGRIGFLSAIIASYGAYADEISGVVRPTLYTAMPLEADKVQGIKDALATTTGKKVVLTVEVDPSLIGGVVTKIGDMIYDGSIRTQLNQIEGILQKG